MCFIHSWQWVLKSLLAGKTSQAILCSCILTVIWYIVTCVSYSLKCHYGSFVSFEGWQPRWFVLEGGTLSYYDSQEDAWKGCKGSIKISVCEIQGKGKCMPNLSRKPNNGYITSIYSSGCHKTLTQSSGTFMSQGLIFITVLETFFYISCHQNLFLSTFQIMILWFYSFLRPRLSNPAIKNHCKSMNYYMVITVK